MTSALHIGRGAGAEMRRMPDELPFPDASLATITVEAALQHAHDLGRAIEEIWRVAEPGASIVITEPDWDTLAIDAGPLSVTRAVCRAWADSVDNPVAGRQIARRLRKLGAEVDVQPLGTAFTDLAAAEQELPLRELAGRTLSPAAARSWTRSLEERDASGGFLAAVTYFKVSARRPE